MSTYKSFVSSNIQKRIAVYPGSFDPITMGHLDIIKRAKVLFDRLIIVIPQNPKKECLFSLEDRLQMIKNCFPGDEGRIEVDYTHGLLIDYASTKGAGVIVRGLRALSDFDYEFQLALMNRKIEREVETVFLMTGLRWIYISSSIIKDVARHGGDISGLVPNHVCEALRSCFVG